MALSILLLPLGLDFDRAAKLRKIALNRLAQVKQNAFRVAFLLQALDDVRHSLTRIGEVFPIKARQLVEYGRGLLVVRDAENFVERGGKLNFAAPPTIAGVILDRPRAIEHQLSALTHH
ncbi:hypothetical protein D3C87_1827160 [compost metagenome]